MSMMRLQARPATSIKGHPGARGHPHVALVGRGKRRSYNLPRPREATSGRPRQIVAGVGEGAASRDSSTNS